MSPVTIYDIIQARDALQGVASRTPLEYSANLSKILSREVYLKYENMQKTGSFKIRGAYNKIFKLTDEERARGVIAASAGNHAQGVANAAAKAGIDATIVMPEGVPIAKLMATKNYGANVILSGQSYDEAYVRAEALQKEYKLTLIHAFNDPAIIAGQGTIGLEILDGLPDIDTVVVPVGGGGLISGVAIALKYMNPRIKIIGVQATGAPSMQLALTSGGIKELGCVATIADGIAIKHPGTLTFPLIRRLVDDLVLVNDEEIAEAILIMLEREKVLCEGAGAVGIAALLNQRIKPDGKTVIVVTGGNIDVHTLSIIIERGLIKAGRYLRFKTTIVDKPGALQKLLEIISDTKANVISVNHERILPRVPISRAEIQIDLETRDSEHVDSIFQILESKGYCIMKEE